VTGRPTPSRIAVRRLFLWALALVYLIAFLSLLVQVRGLLGAHGILPVAELLDYVRQRVPDARRFWLLPTVFWLDASDAALLAVCGAGAALAVVLALEVAPALVLAASGQWPTTSKCSRPMIRAAAIPRSRRPQRARWTGTRRCPQRACW